MHRFLYPFIALLGAVPATETRVKSAQIFDGTFSLRVLVYKVHHECYTS